MKIKKWISGVKLKFGGVVHHGWLPHGAAEPRPTPVKETILDLRIEETKDGTFLLYWRSSNPDYISSDSWHKTLAEALEAAKEVFGVAPESWVDDKYEKGA